MNTLLVFITIVQVIIILVIALAIFSERRLRQAGLREAHYQDIRSDFIGICNEIEQLPFYPWQTGFPRGEPFTAIDDQVLKTASHASEARQAFSTLAERLSLSTAPAPRIQDLLVDVSGNFRRWLQWREDEKSLLTAARLAQEQRQTLSALKQLFQEERNARSRVRDAIPANRQNLNGLAIVSRKLDDEHARQVAALIASARASLDCAMEALEGAPLVLTTPPDDGARFALAHLATQIAGIYLQHVTVLDEITRQSPWVDETALFDQFDTLYPGCQKLASLQYAPDWSQLKSASAELAGQQALLAAFQAGLQGQVRGSSEYWYNLNNLLNETGAEIQRAKTAEEGLVYYLGSIDKAPQAWEKVSGMVGRVSDKLAQLSEKVQALTRSPDERLASPEHVSSLQPLQECFAFLKIGSNAMQEKLAELRQEQNRLLARFDGEGSTALLLARLQAAAADCPSESQAALENLIDRLFNLRSQLTLCEVNYAFLSARLDRLESEGQDLLREHQTQVEQQLGIAAAAQTSYQDLCAHYSILKDRIPRFDNDWSAVEKWVNNLYPFDSSRAGFRAADTYLKTNQPGYDNSVLEVEKIEQYYQGFDKRVAEVTDPARHNRAVISQNAAAVESSPWVRIFATIVPSLRQLEEEYGQQVDRAQAACNLPRIEDALKELLQIEEKNKEIYQRLMAVDASYSGQFSDLTERLNQYANSRARFIQSQANAGSETLQTADGHCSLALNAADYQTALQALEHAINLL